MISDHKEIISGFHAVLSFLEKKPHLIERLLISETRHDQRMQQLLAIANRQKIKIDQVDAHQLDELTKNKKHQGFVAIIKHEESQDLKSFITSLLQPPFLLVLDGVQDPHNLGACLRTANAAGVHAVITPKDRAVGITPAVTKVASGATATTPLFQVTNLARTLQMLKDQGIWLFGASEHAKQLYTQVNYSGATAIIFGAEDKGLRRLTQEYCDFLIRIPMLGTVTSLNVSVAAGICLFEAVRQRFQK
jgi:23S rRNA (guanosine2251-2'-O)-methyltransferase